MLFFQLLLALVLAVSIYTGAAENLRVPAPKKKAEGGQDVQHDLEAIGKAAHHDFLKRIGKLRLDQHTESVKAQNSGKIQVTPDAEKDAHAERDLAFLMKEETHHEERSLQASNPNMPPRLSLANHIYLDEKKYSDPKCTAASLTSQSTLKAGNCQSYDPWEDNNPWYYFVQTAVMHTRPDKTMEAATVTVKYNDNRCETSPMYNAEVSMYTPLNKCHSYGWNEYRRVNRLVSAPTPADYTLPGVLVREYTSSTTCQKNKDSEIKSSTWESKGYVDSCTYMYYSWGFYYYSKITCVDGVLKTKVYYDDFACSNESNYLYNYDLTDDCYISSSPTRSVCTGGNW